MNLLAPLASALLAFGATAFALALTGCNPRPTAGPPGRVESGGQSLVARGAKLVSIGGCNDCHTPMKLDPALGIPVPQMDRMLSGHPEGAPDPATPIQGSDSAVVGPTFTSFRLPFGVSYAANLTPDLETGIGSWTEEMFVRAMRTGKHFGGAGRPILPPMPWPTLAAQTDDDLKAIFAYLRSIPPIRNGVPEAQVPQEALDHLDSAYQKMLAGAPAAHAAAR
jgi:hypothetical protein